MIVSEAAAGPAGWIGVAVLVGGTLAAAAGSVYAGNALADLVESYAARWYDDILTWFGVR